MGKFWDLVSHPEEILPLVRMYREAKKAARLPQDPDLKFCYGMLNRVSRSFAIVIQQLPQPLRDAVCVFYLVLRALDTIEDDMSIDDSVKVPELLNFHKEIYNREYRRDWGDRDYRDLMQQYPHVTNVFLSLDESFQKVIADITRRMGAGMAEFIQAEVRVIKDYDMYCHYVAGLVGIGLCQLFASSELESQEFKEAEMEDLANHMGLFLQKTNIIRDYLEDIMEEPRPRMFWPKSVWACYGKSLDDFKDPSNRQQAVQCLNHMITNALTHLPKCIEYMKKLRHPSVFRFCAIPQIMAAGTLALCYNNGAVFEGVVKMRRGQTARVFEECQDMRDVGTWFLQFLEEIDRKCKEEVAPNDPNLHDTQKRVEADIKEVKELLAEYQKPVAPASIATWLSQYTLLTLSGTYFYYAWGFGTDIATTLQPYMDYLKQQEQLHRAVSAVALVLVLLVVLLSRK